MADAPTPPAPPAGGGGGGGGGGGRGGAAALLRGKIFGMPRWLFAALLVGGIAGGLYLRSRSQAAADVADETGASDATNLGSPYGDSAGMAGLDAMAGSGVLPGPANGAVLPVNAPTIPEGFPEVFAGLGDVIGSLAGGLVDSTYGASPPVVNVVRKGKGPAGQAGKRGRKGKRGEKGKRGPAGHDAKHHPKRKQHQYRATGGGPPGHGGNKAHAVIRTKGHHGAPVQHPHARPHRRHR